ncbi:permease prefix domain 1-containing protein [Planctomyces sp. SH-PL14]|uniref:permease prefix domain 1-containing protein n=1 Tax=Planctomyces sp. SH-PL14 TaxID=1632864 RepID=UPI00078E1A39|nr:permease prefix domain 1-containing protein [Planctomyces sp. SH-PL14]AMV20999.1 hypothetical protein VT03_24060 [Planctomyces sp. SH-PL14]
MSEQEFDLYLRLMSRLLRLSKDQEAAIADELRDHMEERFTELLRAGLTREQAIERALGEFGDAAGLAREFSSLAWRKRRRFWTRVSLASAVTAAGVAIGLVSFWPRPGFVPLIANPLLADNDAEKITKPAAESPAEENSAPSEASGLVIHSSAKAGLPRELTMPVSLELVDVTLKELTDHLSQTTALPIKFDAAVTEAGVNPEEARTKLITSGPLFEVLDRLFDDTIEGNLLSWTYRDGLIHITTEDDMVGRLFVRSYDVSPLVAHGIAVEAVAGLIPGATSGSWDIEEPGTSTINPLGRRLVIKADFRQHRKIAGLLAGLQSIFGSKTDVILTDEPESTLQIPEMLRKPGSFEFPDNPLAEVGQWILETQRVPIRFHSSVVEAGVNPDEARINLTLLNKPLSVVLGLMLENVQGTELEAVPHLGELSVMTADTAYGLYATGVYRIRAFEEADVTTELIAAIYATTGPWDRDEPGTGTLQQPHPGVLVIRHTARVHAEIQRLIAEHQKTLVAVTPEERAERDRHFEIRLYRLKGESEDDIVQIIQTTVEPESWNSITPGGEASWTRMVHINRPSDLIGAGLGGGGFGGGMGGGFFQIGGAPVVTPPGGPGAPAAAPTNGPGTSSAPMTGGGGMGGGGMGGVGGAGGMESKKEAAFEPTTVLLVRNTHGVHRKIDALLHSIRRKALMPFDSPSAPSLEPIPEYGTVFKLPGSGG